MPPGRDRRSAARPAWFAPTITSATPKAKNDAKVRASTRAVVARRSGALAPRGSPRGRRAPIQARGVRSGDVWLPIEAPREPRTPPTSSPMPRVPRARAGEEEPWWTAPSTSTPTRPGSGSTRSTPCSSSEGAERAHFLIERLIDKARRSGRPPALHGDHRLRQHDPRPARSRRCPGEPGLEHRIRSIVRWNALAMVVQANRESAELGGHIASFASRGDALRRRLQPLLPRAAPTTSGGDLVYIQGHSSPGIYARAFLEGRLSEEQLRTLPPRGRRARALLVPAPVADARLLAVPDRVDGPRPDHGDLPGALHASTCDHRGLARRRASARSGCFVGDGEMDEPESLGAIALAAREKLDNLIFVVNCNLQRLDGPVRGNGKIIQELEGTFRGAGWNVIKVIWGDRWDPLLAQGQARACCSSAWKRRSTATTRTTRCAAAPTRASTSSATYPELRAMVANMTDDDIWQLEPRRPRSAEDLRRLRRRREAHAGQPTVILAKTVKGYGMGEAGEGKNITHQQKKIGEDALQGVPRSLPHPDPRRAASREAPFYKPPETAPRSATCTSAAQALGGYLPARRAARAAARDPAARALRRRCSRARATARSPPRWRSCAC